MRPPGVREPGERRGRGSARVAGAGMRRRRPGARHPAANRSGAARQEVATRLAWTCPIQGDAVVKASGEPFAGLGARVKGHHRTTA